MPATSGGGDLRIHPRLAERLHREWRDHPSLRNAISLDRLAELPDHLAELLIRDDTVRSIHIGTGGVPELDDMGALRGVPVRNDRPDLWDNRAGAFRDGRLLVGDIPAATVDLMAHELGHAICVADHMASYHREFARLYRAALPTAPHAWHDREEFFAEAWASVFVQDDDRIVELAGTEDLAEHLWVWFAVRYAL